MGEKKDSSIFGFLLAAVLVCALAAVALAPQAFASEAQQAPMNATVSAVLIYSNNMAYVSSTGSAYATQAGNAVLRIENFSNNAILGTLRAQDDAGTVFYMKRYYDENTKTVKTERYLTYDELLNASYGKAVTVKIGDKEMEGTLMWVQYGMVGVKGSDGKLVVATPDRVDIAAGETKKVDEKNSTEYARGLEIYMSNAKAGMHAVSLTYITTGAIWTPTYNLEVAGNEVKGNGKLTALAEVSNNADEDWKNAVMRLAVGSPYFVEGNGYAPSQYRNYQLENAQVAKGAYDSSSGGAPSFSGESLGTQYIYTLSEPVTLKKGEKANFQLFTSGAAYERDNVWEGYGAVQQVMRVKNDAGKPFASGVMRVYEDGAFSGEGVIAYTGVSREVEAKYAALPQITVKKETNQTADNPMIGKRETVYTVSMNVESSALQQKPLTLRDTMAYGDKVELVSSSAAVKQLSDNKLEWKLTVPSGANMTVTYVYKVTSFDSRYY